LSSKINISRPYVTPNVINSLWEVLWILPLNSQYSNKNWQNLLPGLCTCRWRLKYGRAWTGFFPIRDLFNGKKGKLYLMIFFICTCMFHMSLLQLLKISVNISHCNWMKNCLFSDVYITNDFTTIGTIFRALFGTDKDHQL